jgi:hypothetical protein
VRNIILTGCIFCGPLFLTFCFLNSVAWGSNSTAALPAGTIVIILLIWMLVTAPLLIIGGIAGKNSRVSECVGVCFSDKWKCGHVSKVLFALEQVPSGCEIGQRLCSGGAVIKFLLDV